MSASREKKNRQGDTALSEKERQQAAKAAESKKKTRLYTILGVVAAVAVAALLFWDSGILQRNATAVTIGDEEFSVADASYFYNQYKSNYINQMTSLQQLYDIESGYDTALSPADQVYSTDETTGEETTYEDFFKEGALTTMQQVVALSKAAEAAGHTLSEQGQTDLEAQDQQVDQLASQYGISRQAVLQSLFGVHVTEEIYEKNMAMSMLANDYATAYEADVDTSDEALEAYYEENPDMLDSYIYRYAFIDGQPEAELDEEGNAIEATEEESAAAMADAKARAEAMLAAVNEGQLFDEIARDYVSELSRDAYSTENYTLRSGVLGANLSTIYQDWMVDGARKTGDTEVFESEGSGYVLVQFVERGRDDTPTVDVRHILVAPDSEDESATEFTDDQWAAAEDEAQRILSEFMGGEMTAEAFGELAETYSEDGRNEDGTLATAGGLYTNVAPGQMVTAFNDWIFDQGRAVGDTDLVKTEFGWHVMYFQASHEPVWKTSASTSLVTDTVNTWMEELMAGYQITEQSGMDQVGG